MEILTKLFDTGDFTPRWHCGVWSAVHGYTHIVADILIFVAYATIPATLAIFLLKRPGMRFHGVIWLFVAFILSCGLTHLVEAVIFYHPIYRFSALMKVITATVSLGTALVLIRAMPIVLSLPAARQEASRLTTELSLAQEESRLLSEVRSDLETRTAHLALRGRRLTTAMSHAGVCACQWDAETGVMEWEIGFADLRREWGLQVSELESWQALLGPEAARRLAEACARASMEDTMIFEAPAAGTPDKIIRLSGSPLPPVKGQPRVMSGMFRVGLRGSSA